MKILITGGTGLVGCALIDILLQKGHTVSVLTRNANKAKKTLGDNVVFITDINLLPSLNDFEAVINLAGEPIAGKRWTAKQKERLCNSRWNITRKLAQLIQSSTSPPKVFISGSAVGYYGAYSNEELTEDSVPHIEFTNTLCLQWETLALDAQSSTTRVCLLRTGIILSAKGGMLPKMALPFRWYMGAIVGKGSQYISWIHIDDMVGAICHLLDTEDAKGAFNMTAPHAATNAEFSRSLAKALHRPCIFRVPAFVLRLAMGESATLLIDGQRAIPKHLKDMGYTFRFENVEDALKDIYKKCD